MTSVNQRTIETLRDGKRVVIVKVPGCDGFIASYWTDQGRMVFGHGMSRLEAKMMLAERLHRGETGQ